MWIIIVKIFCIYGYLFILKEKLEIWNKSTATRVQFDMEFLSSDGMLASMAPPKDIGISPPPDGGPVILFWLFGETKLLLSVA